MSIVKLSSKSKDAVITSALLGKSSTAAIPQKPATSWNVFGEEKKSQAGWLPRGRLPSWRENWWLLFPFILMVLASIVAIRSHVPNTWLTGWDTLHPEFDFRLNVWRVIWGVFRPDQGLGSVATHAHIVELPRILILWLLSIVVPTELLRYSYVAICLVLGPVGIFVFTRYLLLKSKFDVAIASTAAFCAGLWYLFNLGTLQHFALPFEMFPTNYAANGWLFWLLWKYLEKGKYRDLFWLVVINFIASNMAYSFISWYVYFGGVILTIGSIIACKLIWKSHFAQGYFEIKRGFIAALSIIVANLYWLGPNVYFVATHSWHVPFAKNNRFVSEEIFLHNKEFGTVLDTITMKNHLFNWMIRDGKNFVLIFKDYITYLNGLVGWIPVVLFVIIAVGIVGTIRYAFRKNTPTKTIWLAPMLLSLVASVVAFLSLNPPLSLIFDVLRDNISIAKEGLRNPFIKFNLLLMLGYATYFAIGMAVVMTKLKSWLNKTSAVALGLIFTITLTGVLGWPFLQGKLIDSRVQLPIPQEYFSMFTWFNDQPEHLRVLVLPAPHFWAWDYHDWGYQGAGFMWFGIKQPFFSRDSDRWNPYNEEAYREISTAIAAQDGKTLYSLLEKYQVGYVVFDQTVSTNGEKPSLLFKNEIERLLSNSTLFTQHSFSDKLSVYQTNSLKNSTDSPNQEIQSAAVVAPSYMWNYQDSAFEQLGNYITKSNDTQTTYYPGREIITPLDRLNTDVLKIDTKQLLLTTNTNQELTYSLVNQNTISFTVLLRNNGQESFVLLNPVLPFTTQNQDTFSTALPITIPDDEAGLFHLVINGTVFKASKQIQAEDQVLGSIKLQLGKENTLNTYLDVKPSTTNYLPTEGTAIDFNCSVVGSTAKTSAEFKPNSVVLQAEKNGSSCVQYPLNPTTASINQGTSLAQITFGFSSLDRNQTNAEICLFDTINNSCLNQQTVFSSALDKEITEASILTELTATTSGATQLLLVLDNDQSDKNAQLTFRQIDVGFSQPSSETSFEVRLPENYANPTLAASNTVVFPLEEKSSLVTLSNLKHNVDRCGSTAKGIIAREVMGEATNQFVRYSAQYGQSCDQIPFDNLTHNQGYLVAISSRNVSGIPARVCIRNLNSGRCDLYVPLGTQTEFVTEYFVLPPTDEGTGYTTQLVTFAPGQFASTADIQSIEFIPIPFDLIASLRTKEVVKTTDDQIVVSNRQSFESNFLAGWYKPPFDFKILTDHVLVNNWANGWLLNKNDFNQVKTSGYRFVTFFVPNILVPAGLVGVIALLSTILVLWRRKR